MKESGKKQQEPIEIPEIESTGSDKGEWTSLEIVKLLVAASLPLVLFFMGKQFEHQSEHQAELRSAADHEVAKRIELWDSLSKPLNNIYCYYIYVGNWKQLYSTNIIDEKRKADQIIYSYRPFFSRDFITKYDEFMKATFKMDGHEWATDAQLRTVRVRPNDANASDNAFTGENNATNIHNAYFNLLNYLATEMNLPTQGTPDIPMLPLWVAQVAQSDPAWRDAELAIRWVFQDAGARQNYLIARNGNKSPYEAILFAQKHNPEAVYSVTKYGESNTVKYIVSNAMTAGSRH